MENNTTRETVPEVKIVTVTVNGSFFNLVFLCFTMGAACGVGFYFGNMSGRIWESVLYQGKLIH